MSLKACSKLFQLQVSFVVVVVVFFFFLSNYENTNMPVLSFTL